MYSRTAWTQAPWTGTLLPPRATGVLPPPIPGDRATFSYAAPQVGRPWAYLSWAGGYPLPRYPGGGVLAHEDNDAGVVRVQAWWPDASILSLVRILPSGLRTPVRGGYPITVAGTTRRNLCTNPSIEAGANGFVPSDGNPTLTRVATPGAPDRTAYLRALTTTAGSNAVVLPIALAGVTLTTPLTVALSLRASAKPTTLTVSMAWLDAAGGALATTAAPSDANERAAVVSQFSRIVKQLTVPAGAVNGTLKVYVNGLPLNGTADYDAITVEAADTAGTYFDGTSLSGIWLGTAELSTSVLSPISQVVDAEAPVGVPLTYEVSSAAITGGRVTSTPPVTLNTGETSWLTHPVHPGQTVKVLLLRVPTLDRPVAQGVFLPIGAARPVVVSSARRQAPVGSLDFVLLSFDERNTLLALLADPFPVLLRLPPTYGYAAPMWLAVSGLTEERGPRKGWQEAMILTAEVVEVDAPAMP